MGNKMNKMLPDNAVLCHSLPLPSQARRWECRALWNWKNSQSRDLRHMNYLIISILTILPISLITRQLFSQIKQKPKLLVQPQALAYGRAIIIFSLDFSSLILSTKTYSCDFLLSDQVSTGMINAVLRLSGWHEDVACPDFTVDMILMVINISWVCHWSLELFLMMRQF